MRVGKNVFVHYSEIYTVVVAVGSVKAMRRGAFFVG